MAFVGIVLPAGSTVSLGIGGVWVHNQNAKHIFKEATCCHAKSFMSILFSSEGRSRAFECSGWAPKAFLHHHDHKNTSRLISNVLTGYLQNKSARVSGKII